VIVQPCQLGIAKAFVSENHRHAKNPPLGHKFSLALLDEAGCVRGVAMVGRPVSRILQERGYWEITRNTTDGARNGCSMLYGAACKEASKRGAAVVCTYTRHDELGSSLKAANFVAVAKVRGRRSWSCKSRPRTDKQERVDRVRWEWRPKRTAMEKR
jgi:hypothetical protein